MTATVPEIFDRRLKRLRHWRAATRLQAGGNPADFLLRHIADDMNERLLDINRVFDKALIISPMPTSLSMMTALADKTVTCTLAAPSDGVQADMTLDEEAPNLSPESYDLIISIGGLHCVNDLPGTLIQYRQALKPDGLLLAGFAGGDTLTELRQSFAAAETECEGGVSPHVFPFGDLAVLGSLVQRAGFALPVADTERLTVRYPTPFNLLDDLRAMGESNIMCDRKRTPLRRQTLMRCMEIYRTRFVEADGKVPASFEIHTLSGWAPHEDQQKPLRPGSAKMRLADALGSKEEKI